MASQTITGPELQYTQDNQRCYAYNALSIGTAETALLEFTTSSGTIVAQIQFNKTNEDGDDYLFQVYLNDEVVSGWVNFYGATGTSINNTTRIIIPPHTAVKCTADNVAGGSARPINCGLTGRVYEYLPVRN